MANSKPDRLLIEAAVSIKRSAPEVWDKFLEALKEYNDGLKNDCVRSPVQVLEVAQGRAQAIGALHDLLAHAHETAERIEQKERGKRHEYASSNG